MVLPRSGIDSWQAFAYKVRANQDKLLTRLDDYRDSILVTGCQRSGGTMLSRLLTQSEGLVNYWWTKDEELDAALVLAGRHAIPTIGRHCFQTTYLNERYVEYAEHPEHKIIWALRNPLSVAFSMVYNWKRFALNELFIQCGLSEMNSSDRIRFQRFGIIGVPPLRRAAYAYAGKVRQLVWLRENYPPSRLVVLEYDQLVENKLELLPNLYRFVDLDYKDAYAGFISAGSLKKKEALNTVQATTVSEICDDIYRQTLGFVNLKKDVVG